jgi:hypothetical protein
MLRSPRRSPAREIADLLGCYAGPHKTYGQPSEQAYSVHIPQKRDAK